MHAGKASKKLLKEFQASVKTVPAEAREEALMKKIAALVRPKRVCAWFISQVDRCIDARKLPGRAGHLRAAEQSRGGQGGVMSGGYHVISCVDELQALAAKTNENAKLNKVKSTLELLCRELQHANDLLKVSVVLLECNNTRICLSS